MNSLRCIVFDMDGTLTQTAPLIYESFNYIAKKYTGKTYSIPEIIAKFGPPEEVVISSFVGPEKADEAMEDYLKFYRNNHKNMAGIFPGIEYILSVIKTNGLRLAIFTGKGKRTAEITLEEFSIKRYFDYIITGNDVENHKPAADGLKMIMKYFSLQPEELLMVGDSKADIEAAHKANIKVAAVVWDSYSEKEILSMGADFLFHNVKEFETWLMNNINNKVG